MSGDNSAQDGEVRVQFAPGKPHRTVALAVVETMIQRWYERNPAQFGYWLADALTDTEPSKSTRSGK